MTPSSELRPLTKPLDGVVVVSVVADGSVADGADAATKEGEDTASEMIEPGIETRPRGEDGTATAGTAGWTI